MAQVNTNTNDSDSITSILAKNINVATTAAFVTNLDVDARLIRDGELFIHNVTAGDLDYQVLVTTEDYDAVVLPTGTNDDDKGWVVHSSASIASAAAIAEITFAKTYTRIIVQIKHTTATTDVNVWFNGVR